MIKSRGQGSHHYGMHNNAHKLLFKLALYFSVLLTDKTLIVVESYRISGFIGESNI